MSWLGTKVWNTGDLMTITDLNNYVGANGDMAWILGDPSWFPLNSTSLGAQYQVWDTLQVSYAYPGFRREGNWVHFRGLATISSGTLARGTTAWLLPFGYRPLYANLSFPGYWGGPPGPTNYNVADITVNMDGTVVPMPTMGYQAAAYTSGSIAYISFDNISFNVAY